LKFKVLISIPVVQATSSSSIDEILREQDRLLVEGLKRARALRVFVRVCSNTPSSRVEGVELEVGC
jgi:hypothetical protein